MRDFDDVCEQPVTIIASNITILLHSSKNKISGDISNVPIEKINFEWANTKEFKAFKIEPPKIDFITTSSLF